MKSTNNAIILSSLFFLVISCGPTKQESSKEDAQVEEVKPISLVKVPASPEYADATLGMANMDVKKGDSTYSASFNFEVANYELGVQTADAATRGIANSGKGQHIHFIVDNGPYSAHYTPAFTKEMNEGYYTVLAFLSRSYHESVKNGQAFWVDVVKVGEPTEGPDVDLSSEHMFYSRPKGTYSGDDIQNLMLDFFLLNTAISPEGNKIIATINGTQFTIDEWVPYYIQGLEPGEVTVKLELVDKDGQVIPGPFNTVERTVKLME